LFNSYDYFRFTVKSFDKDMKSLSVDLVADERDKMKRQTATKKW